MGYGRRIGVGQGVGQLGPVGGSTPFVERSRHSSEISSGQPATGDLRLTIRRLEERADAAAQARNPLVPV